MDVKNIVFFLLSVVALSESAGAVSPGKDEIYVGNVGQQDIVFCRRAGSDSARYYYKKHGVDIALRGPSYDSLDSYLPTISEDGTFIYKESGYSEAGPTLWNVRKKGGKITGTLLIPKKKRPIPVSLRLVQRIETDDTFGECDSTLDFDRDLRSAYVRAKTDRPVQVTDTISHGDITIEKLFEPVSKATGFRITALSNTDVRKKLNSYLERQFKEDIYRSLECTSVTSMAESPTGSLEQSAEITYVSDRILSIEQRNFGVCGGAHPFGGGTGVSLDMKTGKLIKRSEIFKKIYLESDGFSEEFRVFLVDYYKKSKLPEGEDLSVCFSHSVFLDAWLGKDGIWFSGNDYRAHECGEPFLISYDHLHKTLNTEFLSNVGVSLDIK